MQNAITERPSIPRDGIRAIFWQMTPNRLFSRLNKKAEPQPLIILPDGRTCFHITHWKAGSQWIRNILNDAFGQQVVPPAYFEQQLLEHPIQTGRVYQCAYLDAGVFRTLELPQDTRRVVIIRDLRDTLVSGYFSLRNTHEVPNSMMAKTRQVLQRLSTEDGLLYFAQTWLGANAVIQRSWIEAGEPVIRFEEFIDNPTITAGRMLREFWGLDVNDATVLELMARHTFTRYSGGRRPGEEDSGSHYRKGVAGDWRNYFTPKITRLIKMLYGDILILTGYEKDSKW